LKKLNKRMTLIILLFLILTITSCGFYNKHLKDEVYYNSKPTEIFNGKTFIRLNPKPENMVKISYWTFLKYYFTKSDYTWNENIIVNFAKPKERLKTDEIKAYYINHSTILIQIAGLNIITDPVYSKIAGVFNFIGPKRHHPAGIKFEDLPPIDIILISHSHYDHMDMPTIEKIIKRDKSKIITLTGNDYILHREDPKYNITALLWGESISIPIQDKILTINAESAYHWSRRGLHDENKALWGSFVIQYNNTNIYYAGDTALHNGEIFKNLQKKYQYFNLAFIPIGAYIPYDFMKYSHTSPADSVEIHKMINSNKSIGIHWGTFQLGRDAYNQPREDLAKSLLDNKINDNSFITIKPGEVVDVN
jgi:L-ascorbate metabolism protein UlaG (beta-lactamase superfamily)